MILNIFNNNKILKEKFNLFLPDFTILTGGNGSGKTQLLQSLMDQMGEYHNYFYNAQMSDAENAKMIFPVLDDNGKELGNKVFSSPGLLDSEKNISGQQSLIQQIKNEWNNLNYIARSYNSLKYKDFQSDDAELQILNNEIINLARFLNNSNHFNSNSVKKASIHQLQKLKTISSKANKTIDEIYFIDFLIFYEAPTKLFSSALDLLFHQFYLKTKYFPHLTENVIPPWEIFNQILAKAKFRYKTKYTPLDNEENPPQVKLIDKDTNIDNVTFSGLSSGEKTIMSLIFVLYHASNSGKFPEIVLFDEPDAHLHPQLTDLFLSVIQDVLVKEHNVKVILTTHSPSTVAIAPEDSIYRMSRDLGYPIKESKSKALKVLTSGVPFLSINYEDRRQIFVESNYDAEFYEKIYLILQPFLNSEISLNFISSGDSKLNHNGSCSQVEIITDVLRKSGNNSVWGIIDYDDKNSSNDYIKVLGVKERYSIENFILDPLLISALLIREKIIEKEYFGLTSKENYYDFKSFDKNKLQLIINKYFLKFEEMENEDIEEVVLLNETIIKIPKWYLNHQGHKLEDKILNIFPGLNDIKRQKEKALKIAIIEKVIDDVPEIMPKAFFNIFNILQQ